MFTANIFDIDRRIAQTFLATIAISGTLLSALAIEMFDRTSIWIAYACLAPTLLTFVAFAYLTSQRREVVQFGAYVRVLERLIGVAGFQTSLDVMRSQKGGEGNDHIPYSFWAVFILSASLYMFGLQASEAFWAHYLSLLLPASGLAFFHIGWYRVISRELVDLTRLWTKWADQLENDV